jgi:hypothetical protein
MNRLSRALSRAAIFALTLLPAYAGLAYVVVPAAWQRYERRLPRPKDPSLTYTAEGIPADPINVALVGTRESLCAAMREAGWAEADRISMRSGLRDAGSVLFARPYVSAPVSTHFRHGLPQDLAFERIVGGSPRRRHHVRFWESSERRDGLPVWIGAASYDCGLGFSRYTGEVMHHIDPQVDVERETLFDELSRAGALQGVERLMSFRPEGPGFNGGGDSYRSDGALLRGFLARGLSRPDASPAR